MLFLSNRNKKLFNNIIGFLNSADEVMKNFEKGLKHYLKNGIDAKFNELMDMTNKYESKTDDILHDITISLYKKSLLPESREDILILLNKIDDIVDEANLILKFIYTHNLKFHSLLKEDTKEMMKISIKAFELTVDCVKDLFDKRDNIISYTGKIDSYESICDSLQFKMIKNIFDSDIKDFDKIILRDFVNDIAEISDLCEQASHMITVMNIKRVV